MSISAKADAMSIEAASWAGLGNETLFAGPVWRFEWKCVAG
jgi:hypothetical protein